MTTEQGTSAHDAEPDQRNDNILIYVNGEIVPRADARVSVYDSGFMLGDGVWEGLRLHAGAWGFLDDHLDRLFAALKAIDLNPGMDRGDIIAALEATQVANGMSDHAHARLMITRGVKGRPFQHPDLSSSGPTVVIIVEHSLPIVHSRGLRLFTVPIVRGLPNSQDTTLNTHSKLNCILAGIHAAKAGADEALMLDPLGFVNTTNSCNFFIVRRGEVWTSSGDYCLNGITRGKVIELCQANHIPVSQRNFSLADVYGAEEAFLTGTFSGLTPVADIDGRGFGDGGPGKTTRRLSVLYDELVHTGAPI